MILVPVVDEFGGVHRKKLLASSSWLPANPSTERDEVNLFGQQPEASSQKLFLRRQGQPENRNHSLAGDIHFRFRRIRQIERLAMFAAINFGIRPPGLFGVAASLLDHIFRVEPALQMSAAEFSLFVLLVAGALPRLLNLDLVMGKLRRSLRA
jgi:hypothetical protein